MIFDVKKEDINIDNAKDIYIKHSGFIGVRDEIYEFYINNFTENDFLDWNDIIFNNYLENVEKLIDNDDLQSVHDMCRYFGRCAYAYNKNRESYLRLISLLKKFFYKFGYFACFSFEYWKYFKKESDLIAFELFKWMHIEYFKKYEKINQTDSLASFYHYSNNKHITGIIPMLDQLGYTDVLYKYIEEIFNPMLENYDKPREYLDKRNIKYDEPVGFKNLLPYRYMLEVYKDRKDILDLLKK